MSATACYGIVHRRAGFGEFEWRRCERCGSSEPGSCHHRLKPGRVSTPSNVVWLCGSGTTGCHGWVEAHPDAAEREGFWIRPGVDPAHDPDPAQVPITHHLWGLVLLTEDGMYVPTGPLGV